MEGFGPGRAGEERAAGERRGGDGRGERRGGATAEVRVGDVG